MNKKQSSSLSFHKKLKNSKTGFTLIELLIVIGIIGILAVAFLPSLLNAPSKARDTQRVAAANDLNTFFLNRSLTGAFPEVATECLKPGGGGVSAVIDANLSDFSGVFPLDPLGESHKLDNCDGQYVIFKPGANLGKQYYGVIGVKVENADNANITCDLLVDGIDELKLGPVEENDVNDAKGYCYAAGVVK